MRYLKKRILVKNDGCCRSKEKASSRVMNASLRYINKMIPRGWLPTSYCAGNAFFYYEAYVNMIKPTTVSEAARAKAISAEYRYPEWKIENGVCRVED